MELLHLVLLALLGVGAVVFLITRQTREYGKQLGQLQPKARAKREKPAFRAYSLAEVAEHSTIDDAWIIIQHRESKEWRVYDITDYRDDHPGGDVILNNAGGNATSGFYGAHHPNTTFVIVEDFCIGTLSLAEGEEVPASK